MLLVRVHVVGVGPLDEMKLSLGDGEAPPRQVAVVLGSGGVGKTSLLSAIATTRPGLATVPQARGRRRAGAPSQVVAHWVLGHDDPTRPHPLRITSPNAALDEPEAETLLRRREAALHDRRAAEGGHLLLAFPACRWFSRSSILLTSIERTVAHHDPRALASFDDATRADLARETKQALSYSAIAAALSREAPTRQRFQELARVMVDVVSALCGLSGYPFLGADAATLEPIFASPSGDEVLFDELPAATKHLAAFAALTVRALFAAYPLISPRDAEGVVLIDEIELHQEPSIARQILPALREALPRVQWVVTTSSLDVAHSCEPGELVALRRSPPGHRVEIYEGSLAVVH
jgi:hypothetical protein